MSGIQPGTEKLKIVVFGGAGRLGSHIVAEALRRGHTVTVATTDPATIASGSSGVSVVAADVTDPEAVMATAAGHDVVVSAVGASSHSGTGAQVVSDAAQALLVALPQAGVRRLVVLGATGTLEVAPGLQLVDLPEFPAEYRAVAIAHREALDLYRGEASGLEWTVVTPPAAIEGARRPAAIESGATRPWLRTAATSALPIWRGR